MTRQQQRLHRFVKRFRFQKQAAEQLNISQSYLVDLLRGRRAVSANIEAQLDYLKGKA